MSSTAELQGELSLNAAPFHSALARAAAAGTNFGQHVGKAINDGASGGLTHLGNAVKSLVTGPMAALATAFAGVLAGGAMLNGIKNAYDLAGHFNDLSAKTGLAVDQLMVLNAVAKDNGLEDVSGAVNKLQRNLSAAASAAGGPVNEALQSLGMTAGDLLKVTPVEQFVKLGDAINAIGDPAQKTATAMALFGKSGAELLPTFGDTGALGATAQRLGSQAAILARNSAIFDAVSDRLARAGDVFQGFYVGMAKVFAGPALGILQKFEALNLVGMGERFAVEIGKAATLMVGMFEYPQAATYLIGQALQAAFRLAGNVLLASFKSALEFFQTGMLASLQAIGGAIISTLVQAFGRPIAYLQAGIEHAMGTATARQDAEQVQALRAERDSIAEGGKGRRFNPSEQSHIKAVIGQISEIQDKYRNPQSLSERADQIQKQGVRFGMYDGGQTSEQWAETGRGKLDEAFAAVKTTLGNFKIEDVLGSSKYQETTARAASAIQQAGAATVAVGSVPAPAVASALALGWNPAGVSNADAATANRINGINFSSSIGGNTGLSTGGLRTSGLLTGRDYDANTARKRQAAQDKQGAKGTQVTAPDVVAALQTQIAELKTHLTSLLDS